MCSETFLRLPEEKRTRFLDAAWEEFTQVPFTDASINKIVLRARIPRGSFYQYFTDKKELFSYLLKGMMDFFLKEYAAMLRQAEGDFFETQIRCFDRVLLEKNTHPLFIRGMSVLKLNLAVLTQAVEESHLPYRIWDTVKEYVDLSGIRNQDEDLGRQAFVMSLFVLVISMKDAMSNPEKIGECRRELLVRLDVLKHGCFAAQQA